MDVAPEDITSIDDIVKLPFTTKQDLRDNYPYGLQAAPPSEIVRVHASSGTTGSQQQGVRACTSRMRDDLYGVMEERMQAFKADHPLN